MFRYQLREDLKVRLNRKIQDVHALNFKTGGIYGALQDIDTIYSFNLTASLIVKELQSSVTLEEIVKKMSSMFSEQTENISEDIQSILDTFVKRGWVKRILSHE